ncbi:MAG: amidohydrolase, partial [Spirochaetes bacterium]|nr:amidohydrolase [Spirochaetota bacterium]
MSLLIRGAVVPGSTEPGTARDILIEGGRVGLVAPGIGAARASGADVVDASGMAAVPGLVNAHAHSAMTLLRGAAEDMELGPWLSEAIWPREARMSPEDIYWGTRLACQEMLRTGTTLCHDMYLDPRAVAEAARDSGMRYVAGYALIDGLDEARGEAQREACDAFFAELPDYGSLVRFGLAAHSVYATCAESLRYLGRLSSERGLPLHVHLSETEAENRDCKASRGMSPTAYLDSLGALGPRTLAAHCLWLDERDWDILAERGVTVAHNPVSNMKLASGPAFDYEAARSRGIRVLLGTDGAASNNSLDLYADAKIAGLLQKHHYRDPTRFPVGAILGAASKAGYAFFGADAGFAPAGAGSEGLLSEGFLSEGFLSEGAPADIALIDLSKPGMSPVCDAAANLVYAGAGAAVD